MKLKIFVLLIIVLLLTGCSNESDKIRTFEGEVIAINSSYRDRGIVIRNENGRRIKVAGFYSADVMKRADFNTVIVGDYVYVEYTEEFQGANVARIFEIQ